MWPVYVALLAAVERMKVAPDLEYFRKIFWGDYNHLLISESTNGKYIDPEKFVAVTQREIAAGRMTEADEMRALALRGCMVARPNEKHSAVLGKLRLMFGKRS